MELFNKTFRYFYLLRLTQNLSLIFSLANYFLKNWSELLNHSQSNMKFDMRNRNVSFLLQLFSKVRHDDRLMCSDAYADAVQTPQLFLSFPLPHFLWLTFSSRANYLHTTLDHWLFQLNPWRSSVVRPGYILDMKHPFFCFILCVWNLSKVFFCLFSGETASMLKANVVIYCCPCP